jgi:hypothetical protein
MYCCHTLKWHLISVLKHILIFLVQDYHAVDILLAEIDVYELFAFKHCIGRRVQIALCKGTCW